MAGLFCAFTPSTLGISPANQSCAVFCKNCAELSPTNVLAHGIDRHVPQSCDVIWEQELWAV